MAFVKTGRRSFKELFKIRAKSKTEDVRKNELARFKADLTKLAKKYRGTVKETP